MSISPSRLLSTTRFALLGALLLGACSRSTERIEASPRTREPTLQVRSPAASEDGVPLAESSTESMLAALDEQPAEPRTGPQRAPRAPDLPSFAADDDAPWCAERDAA